MQKAENTIQRLLALRDKYEYNDEIRDVCNLAISQLQMFVKEDRNTIDRFFFRGWGKGKDE
jgi:hypothetical protein